VLFPKKIEIYSLTLKKLHTLETKSRFNAVLFAVLPTGGESEDGEEEEEDREVLCVGTEKGVVEVYDVEIGQDDEVEDDQEEKDDEEDEGKVESKGSGADLTKIGELVGHTNR
jgi:protein MAK11